MYLKNSKIIVIKIGSSLLVNDKKKLEKNGYKALLKIFNHWDQKIKK